MKNLVDGEGRVARPAGVAPKNHAYGCAWLALGATILERFDLAECLGEYLVNLQNPGPGGIFFPDGEDGEERAEVCFSAGIGMGFAATGRNEALRRVADWLRLMIEEQAGAECYFNRCRRDGTIVREPAAGVWHKNYDLRADQQRPANYATVVAALVWASRRLRDKSYLATAGQYVDLVYNHQSDPSHFTFASKFGWAMLTLYEDTGNDDLQQRAVRLGRVHLERQEADGLWSTPGMIENPVPAFARLSYACDCAATVCALALLGG
jgi:hypothetical protein